MYGMYGDSDSDGFLMVIRLHMLLCTGRSSINGTRG